VERDSISSAKKSWDSRRILHTEFEAEQ